MVYLIKMSDRNDVFQSEIKKRKSNSTTEKRVPRRIEIIAGPYRYLKYSEKFTNMQCITEYKFSRKFYASLWKTIRLLLQTRHNLCSY